MNHAGKLFASALLAIGGAQATDPASVQDPPGEVDVRQPAGVSLSERGTDADTTDTLGGGRTEVIDGDAPARAGPDIRPSEARGAVQPGTEAQASFEGDTSAGAARPQDTATGDTDAAAEDTPGSTSLGTDIGHGTGTEVPSSSPGR